MILGILGFFPLKISKMSIGKFASSIISLRLQEKNKDLFTLFYICITILKKS